jgi:hypothetical protein
MNRFREHGFIEYKGRIRVHKSLLDVILHDHMPGDNAEMPFITAQVDNRQRQAGRALTSIEPD